MKIAAVLIACTLTGLESAPGPRPVLTQIEPREPRPGDFLIASRRLGDANFAEAVVLLLAAGPDGAQGVVVNRRTPVRAATVLPDLEALAKRTDTLYWGGPVQPQSALLLARVDRPPENAMPLVDGVWVVRTRPGMEQVFRRGAPEASLRIVSGYAGWVSGQLEWELSTGSWHLRRAEADQIFAADPGELWQTLVQIASAPIA